MITELRVHNYFSLVNFELTFGDLNILIGSNGSGKTAAMAALRKLRDVILATGDIQTIFPPLSKTRWLDSDISEFQVSTRQSEGEFEYRLIIRHASGLEKSQILEESLKHNGKSIFSFKDGIIKLFNDSYNKEAEFHGDSTRSGLGIISEGPNNKLLGSFKAQISKVVYVQPNPYLMESLSESEVNMVSSSMDNLSSWIRSLIQDVQIAIDIQAHLANFLEGFRSLVFQDLGVGRRFMTARFKAEGIETMFAFEELSEGQRVIIGLVALIEYAKRYGAILILDEPDNFVSPHIVNLWFAELQARTYYEQEFQCILISHHPQIMDQMVDTGVLFMRAAGGHTITKDVSDDDSKAVSEIMARGWQSGSGD